VAQKIKNLDQKLSLIDQKLASSKEISLSQSAEQKSVAAQKFGRLVVQFFLVIGCDEHISSI
jgi:hypothetical protein